MTHAHYFAFGANMNEKVLRRRRIRLISSEPARLDDHQLVFDLYGLPLVEPGFASVVPESGHTVHGVLYCLEELCFRRLSTFEGPDYKTVELEVVGERNGPCLARTYVTKRPRSGLLPSRRYLQVLCEGARQHGLPERYIESLRQQPSAYVPILSPLFTWSIEVLENVIRLRNQYRRRSL